MSGHKDPEIVRVINSSDQTVKAMNDLQATLEASLKDEWKQIMGIDFPTVANSELFKLDAAMIYASEVKVDEFVTGVMDLANTVFNGNEAAIAVAATNIAKVAIVNIIGGGSVQIGFHGNSGKIRVQGKPTYLAACYSSTQIATASKWGVKEDFYVAKFVYVVQEVAPAVAKALNVSQEITML